MRKKGNLAFCENTTLSKTWCIYRSSMDYRDVVAQCLRLWATDWNVVNSNPSTVHNCCSVLSKTLNAQLLSCILSKVALDKMRQPNQQNVNDFSWVICCWTSLWKVIWYPNEHKKKKYWWVPPENTAVDTPRKHLLNDWNELDAVARDMRDILYLWWT